MTRGTDDKFMDAALAEARKGLGRTGPNPAVGAVLVRGGRIVARGHHSRAGAPHAEVAALRDAARHKVLARHCVLYCTLEPCSHAGRTGPCVEAIIAAGVKEVVFGCIDPNPRVAGSGLRLLGAAGVRVRGPVREEASGEMIRDFSLSLEKRRPYVLVKAGVSLDGRIATVAGESRWITGAAARAQGRELRSEVQAILVGSGTVLTDDPRLTSRTRGGADPLRVVFDSRLRTPPSARAITGAGPGCLIIGHPSAGAKQEVALAAAGATVWRVPGPKGRIDVAAALERLYRERGITRVLLEGGGELASAFFSARAVDELHLFVAPVVLGGAKAPSFVMGEGVARLAKAHRLRFVAARSVGEDLYLLLRSLP